jgi:hypothetical protein
MLPALELMEQAKSAEDTPGRRQAEAAPLRQPRDCQTLREVRSCAQAVVDAHVHLRGGPLNMQL